MQSRLFAICRQVSIEEGDAKAREFSVMFIETSAKAGFNIKVDSCVCRQHITLSSAQASRLYLAVCVEGIMQCCWCWCHQAYSGACTTSCVSILICRPCSERLLLPCRGWSPCPHRNRKTWLMSILLQMQLKAKAQARRELQQAASVDIPFVITA